MAVMAGGVGGEDGGASRPPRFLKDLVRSLVMMALCILIQPVLPRLSSLSNTTPKRNTHACRRVQAIMFAALSLFNTTQSSKTKLTHTCTRMRMPSCMAGGRAAVRHGARGGGASPAQTGGGPRERRLVRLPVCMCVVERLGGRQEYKNARLTETATRPSPVHTLTPIFLPHANKQARVSQVRTGAVGGCRGRPIGRRPRFLQVGMYVCSPCSCPSPGRIQEM